VRPETQQWVALGEEDWSVAQLLLRNRFGRQAVFYTHLSVEKCHNLTELARAASATVPTTVLAFLGRLSPHCVLARYEASPGIYTIDYCEELLAPAGEAIQWLRQLLN